MFSIQRKHSRLVRHMSVSSALIALRWLFVWHWNSSCLPLASFRFCMRPLMWPFMTVNPSIRCLLEVILSASLWIEVGSVLKAKGVAGLDRNLAGAFASLLGYVPRFVLTTPPKTATPRAWSTTTWKSPDFRADSCSAASMYLCTTFSDQTHSFLSCYTVKKRSPGP
jgi:hypothetical protein